MLHKCTQDDATEDSSLLRKWVATWRQAGVELERIRRTDIASADTQEAVRQIFSGYEPASQPPAAPTSGLIEQQAWFARIHRTLSEP
jgi:hypothetical protein